MKKIIIKLGVLSSIALPFITHAQSTGKTKTLDDLIQLVIVYFNKAIYLIIGLAILMFVYNVFKYFIRGGDDVGAKKEAGVYVMWSVVGFFVILSFWGIVNILLNTFNLDRSTPSGFFGSFRSTSSSNSPLNGNIISGGSNNGSVQSGSNGF